MIKKLALEKGKYLRHRNKLYGKKKKEILKTLGLPADQDVASNVWRIHLGYHSSIWVLSEVYAILSFDASNQELQKEKLYG